MRGYGADAGAGWGEVQVGRQRQVSPVRQGRSGGAALPTEPLACCVHAALRGAATKEDIVVVLGAGTIGLLTVAAIRLFTPPKRLIAVAKHPTPRDLAKKLGAHHVIDPADGYPRIRFATRAPRLDGVDRSL